MPELLKKSIKYNTLVMLAAALVLALMGKPDFSAGLLVGAFWSTANFYLTLNLLEIALLQKPKQKLLLLLLIKFPVLYLLGFLILIVKIFPVLSLLLGMSSILLVLGVSGLCLKALNSSTNCRI